MYPSGLMAPASLKGNMMLFHQTQHIKINFWAKKVKLPNLKHVQLSILSKVFVLKALI